MLFSGPGVTPSLKGLTTNIIELQAGACYTIPPGWFQTKPGKYTAFQEYDPITTLYRKVGAGSTGASMEFIYSDGNNYRLANQTGCAVGSRVTSAGTGFTSKPTVVPTAGSSIWLPIIGGAISTTVTVTNGGTNYTYPPVVLFSAPPSPGVQATGYCTLSSGAVSTITVIDQGAGYITPPTVQFINDPREGNNGVAQGYNASAITTLTGANTLTACLCIDHGTPLTSLPTLTISGGGGSGSSATVIMDWTLTSYGVTSNGTGYVSPYFISAYGGFTSVTGAYLNPTIEQNLVAGRQAQILATVTTGAIFSGGQTGFDGGVYPGVPTIFSYGGLPAGGAASTNGVFTANVGGQNDISILLTT